MAGTVTFFSAVLLSVIGTFLTLTALYSVDRFLGLIIRQQKAIKKIATSLPFIHPEPRTTFPHIPFEEAAEKLRLGDYFVLLLLVIPGIFLGSRFWTTGIAFRGPSELDGFSPVLPVFFAWFQTILSIVFIWYYFAGVVVGLSKLVLWIIFGSNLNDQTQIGRKARERRVTWLGFATLLLGILLGVVVYMFDKYLNTA